MKSFDGIIGLALADSMGVPVEFHTRKELEINPVKGVTERGTYNMPAGCWSDDTSLTLATMEGIIRNNGVINRRTYHNIADNFVDYYFKNAFTPTDVMFDIGNTTRNAIIKYFKYHIDPIKAGGNAEYNKGNGALMRILPIAYYAEQNKTTLQDDLAIVADIASITHAHPSCILGSYLYVEYARMLIAGFSKEESYKYIQNIDTKGFPTYVVDEYKRILQGNIKYTPREKISSDGVTRDTLEAALWSFMNNTDYSSTVLTAINLGEDTDTVAAVAGGLAGIHYGKENIPQEWLKYVKRLDYIQKLCDEYDYAIEYKKTPYSFKPVPTQQNRLHDYDESR